MNDRVDTAQFAHLPGNGLCLLEVGQVTDHAVRPPVGEVTGCVQPLMVAPVDHDLVPFMQQSRRGRSTQPVDGTGDQDPGHGPVRVSRPVAPTVAKD